MEYRRLRRDELQELEGPFVRFLAAQGIDAELWAKLKVTDEARTHLLLDQFSAMVFDDVLRRAEYLEERTERQLLVYRCGPDRLVLRGLLLQAGSEDLDFRQNLPPTQLAAALQRSGTRVQVAQAERAYKGSREADLFAMLERGVKIAKTSELYDLVDALNPS